MSGRSLFQFEQTSNAAQTSTYSDGRPIFTFSANPQPSAASQFYYPTDYGMVGDGVTDDSAAWQAAINACQNNGGGVVWGGGFTIGIKSALNITSAGVTIEGVGAGGTTFVPLAGFTGAAVFVVNAPGVSLHDFAIKGASTTYSANPACDGIDITTSYRPQLRNLWMGYLNGWAIHIALSTSADGYYPLLADILATQCAGGLYLQGFSNHEAIGANATNVIMDNIHLNESFRLENVIDVALTNCGGYSTGANMSTVHILGGGFHTITGGDFGALNAGIGACFQFDTGPNGLGDPLAVLVANNIIERGLTGINITAGNSLSFVGNQVFYNQTHGFQMTNGSFITLSGNTFNSNGQTAGAGHYDVYLNVGSGNKVTVNGNTFQTPQGAGAGQVSQAIATSGAGMITGNTFAGASGANAFTGTPQAIWHNLGYNPVGKLSAQPAIPASTVALTNPSAVDCMVYVTGGTVTAIAIGGQATGLTSGGFSVPAGQTITLTYSVAPTWQWYGD